MNQNKIEENLIFSGKTIELFLSKFKGGPNKTLVREVVKRKNAAAVIAITPENKIVLLKQYRQAVEEPLWEIPAGLVDDGETARETAERELAEEAGYKTGDIEEMLHYFSSPGFTNEKVIIFKATSLEYIGASPEEEEEFELQELSLEEALNQVYAEKITDAKTMLAILLLANEQRA